MTATALRDELAATFGHVPSEIHTSKGRTGQQACATCFAAWPCAVVRKIERAMLPVVDRHVAVHLGQQQEVIDRVKALLSPDGVPLHDSKRITVRDLRAALGADL